MLTQKQFYRRKPWLRARQAYIDERVAIDGGICEICHEAPGLIVHHYKVWLDDQNCYWLNPAKSGTLNYLQDIAVELRNLGFDEVMFTEFRFPDTDQLDFSGDRTETIQKAAETLVEKCSTDSFAISFMTTGSTLNAVSGRSRLYVKNVEAADAASAAEKLKTEDPAVNVVFLTDSYDTRYEDYGTLRPISSFAGDE